MKKMAEKTMDKIVSLAKGKRICISGITEDLWRACRIHGIMVILG